MNNTPIVIENTKFRLEIGTNAVAKSLIVKSNGRECLDTSVALPMFSTT